MFGFHGSHFFHLGKEGEVALAFRLLPQGVSMLSPLLTKEVNAFTVSFGQYALSRRGRRGWMYMSIWPSIRALSTLSCVVVADDRTSPLPLPMAFGVPGPYRRTEIER